MRQLRDRAERQQELVSYLKAQMKVTEGAKTDPKAVARLAKEVAREYSSEYDGAKLGARLQEMYDYIASGKDGKGRELTWSALRERAYGIARDVLMESRELNDSMARDYSGLKAYLKETQLTISEADSHDMTDYNAFRQRNQGRMKLKRGSTNIDRVYMELAERWPGLFDETATHPAQQLERIGEENATSPLRRAGEAVILEKTGMRRGTPCSASTKRTIIWTSPRRCWAGPPACVNAMEPSSFAMTRSLRPAITARPEAGKIA